MLDAHKATHAAGRTSTVPSASHLLMLMMLLAVYRLLA